MSSRLSLRVLAVFVLFTLIIPLALIANEVYGDGDDNPYSIPEKAELKYPNLGSTLNQMVARVETRESSAEEAAKEAPVHQGPAVAVTIYLSGNVDDVVAFLEENGGDPRNVGEDYIEAYVPVALLGQVSEQLGVIRVREIIPSLPAQSTPEIAGNGPPVHLTAAWNQAGYSGQGVTVGVIDVGFEGFSSLMGTELPTTVVSRCYIDIGQFTENLDDCEVDSGHGTAVAEAVIDIAPEVSLYIAKPNSPGDLQATVDWMASQGISVINHSVSWVFDGPGDGTSPPPSGDSPLNTVDRAVDSGIVWVNSAGNKAQNTWFESGRSLVINSDGFVEFAPSELFNCFSLKPETSFTAQLRWEDDWPGAARDLDLFLWDTQIGAIVLDSADPQSGEAGHYPLEILRAQYSSAIETTLCFVVELYSGSQPDWVQLQMLSGPDIEHHTSDGSITNPAESANPGMLAVGAAPWYDVHTIESFSSRGPTPDGRIKPDIVGADCGATALAALDRYVEGFCGTSQAAPHVAGMAALVRQRFPSYTPAEVSSYLKTGADPRGDVPNNTWGHGFAWLPPFTRQDSPDRDALVALYRATGGDSWTNQANWLREDAPIALWQGVTTDINNRVTRLYLSDNQLTGEVPDRVGQPRQPAACRYGGTG